MKEKDFFGEKEMETPLGAAVVGAPLGPPDFAASAVHVKPGAGGLDPGDFGLAGAMEEGRTGAGGCLGAEDTDLDRLGTDSEQIGRYPSPILASKCAVRAMGPWGMMVD